jgi:alditol oxidase
VQNWAGNLTYGAQRVVAPRSVDELRVVVGDAAHLKVIGSRHSFNDIADSADTTVSLEHLCAIGEPDAVARTVTVGGGVTYVQVAEHLQARGWALHNLASLPHVSVAGACATATHGSGRANGNLATAVVGMRIVRADGSVELLDSDSDDLRWNAVGLGALGIVAELTLRIEPSFTVRQWVYEGLAIDEVDGLVDSIGSLAYSVSAFTQWTAGRFEQLWVKDREDGSFAGEPLFRGATRSARPLHPVPGVSAAGCTEQLGVPGPWCERLPHFKADSVPSSGDELQSEYFVSVDHADRAVARLFELGTAIAPALLVSEVRVVAGDNLPMSPANGGDVVAFHFTWLPEWDVARRSIEVVEDALRPFGARPHLGKLFAMAPGRLTEVYPNLVEFAELRRRIDRSGKFVNAFLRRHGLAS